MLYRILRLMLPLFVFSALEAQETKLTPVFADADKTSGAAYVVASPANAAEKSTLRLTYDLSTLKQPSTAWAALTVTGNNGEPAEAMAPSLSVQWGDAVVATAMFRHNRERVGGRLIVTDAINRALAEGVKEITFVLSQRGTPGTQRSLLIDKNPLLVVQADLAASYDLDAYLRPLWKPGIMTDESIFFLEPEGGGAAQGKLLFAPNKVLRAHSSDQRTEYKEGVDFKVEGNTVTLLPGSAISAFTYDAFYPKSQEGQRIRTFRFPALDRFALSPEGSWFHQHQVFFTYEHKGDGWQGPRIGETFQSRQLPKTVALLNSDKPLKVALFGDSISAGANASGREGVRPYMPSYGELVVTALREHYNKENIQFLNASLGGMNSPWATSNVKSLVAGEQPDLTIIAFGMNDRLSAAEYVRHTEEVMREIRAQNPDAEFILVAPMQANAMWRNLKPHSDYAKALKQLETRGVFVANVWDVHEELLKTKKYSDMTGNNVNHPNDFLIRVYAQAVAEPLMPLQ